MEPRLLPDLLVLLEVSKAGSITGAATRLHTVQSNVTARIKKLEASLRVPLLTRRARGVKLTHHGEAALSVALRLDAVLNDLRFTFGAGLASRRARLRIGAIETIAASRLPALVADFARAYSHIDVSVRTGSSSSLLEQLRDGELEAAFVSRIPTIPGFRGLLAFEDELIVIVPPAIKTLAEIHGRNRTALNVLVQRPGCSYTERLVTWMAEKGVRPNRLVEMGTLEGIVGLVENGLGIAAMPRAFVDSVASARAVSRLALPKSIHTLNTYLATPAKADSATIVKEFAEFCRTRPFRENRRR